jgi:hypothetical protein
MLTSAVELHALQRSADLEPRLAAVEARLAALAQALTATDSRAIEIEANELHRALAGAVDHFARAARHGGVPPPLRHRLAVATAQVAAQREALARATAALDRAIDVLLPGAGGPGVYGAAGHAERGLASGSLQA